VDTSVVEEIKFVILESLWTSVTVMRNYLEVSTYNNDNYSDGGGGDGGGGDGGGGDGGGGDGGDDDK
jgi:hypothetical protein